MAGKGATLAIRIVSDSSQASQGFAEAESKVAGFQRGLDKASVAAGGVLAGMGAMAKEAYDAASALQQSGGAVETVFGDQAQAVEAMADRAAQALGLSKNAYNEAASIMGSQLQTLGLEHDAVIPTMEALMSRAGDLAATFGGDTSEAVAALSSALKGERDPIERYGIALSQSAVDAKVAALGLDTSTEAAKKAAETQATLALIMDQSKNAHGAFGREADTAAGQTQRAAAEYENAKAALGEVLLPVVADAAGKFSDLTGTLTEHKDAVQVAAGVLGGLALAVLAINGAMRVYAAGQALATAAVWLFNASLWANPIFWVVGLIAALVLAVAIAYKKFEWFRDMVQSVWEWLKKAWDYAGKVMSKVGDFFSAAGPVTIPVQPVMAAGVYGAAAGPGLSGVPMTALAGGGSTAGQGPTVIQPIQVDIHGALDPVAVGRQVEKVLRDYATATGRNVTTTIGPRP